MKKSEECFEALQKDFANALTELPEPTHDLIDRERELHELSLLLARPETPQVILIGNAGSGKTALAKEWAKRQRENGSKVHVYSLLIDSLKRDGEELLQARLASIIPRMKEYERILQEEDKENSVVLFIDEIQKVINSFGKGNKVGGDALKGPLETENLKLITATTIKEYETYIANDDAFGRRLKPLELNQLSPSSTKKVLRDWLNVSAVEDDPEASKEVSSQIPDELLEKVVKANALYREDRTEPAKSIDTVESMISKYKVDKVPFDNKMVEEIFEQQLDIKLATKLDSKTFRQELEDSIKGQPIAVYTVDRMMRRLKSGFDQFKNQDRVRGSAIFAGSTGVGKTAMAKTMARALYGDESKLYTINMPDYKTEASEALFRQNVGSHVRHDPSSIILLDEFEKAGEATQNAMLSILGDGKITFTDLGWDDRPTTTTISLKNTIVIATSNAGAETFDSLNRFGEINRNGKQEDSNLLTQELKRQWRSIQLDIEQGLMADGIKPEIIGRFDRIVPFLSLSDSTMLEIAHKGIEETKHILMDFYGINIRTQPKIEWLHGERFFADELSMFLVFDLAQQEDSKSGGARRIKRLIETEFEEQITLAMDEYPEIRTFDVRLNGKASFQGDGITAGEGEILVEPTVDEIPKANFSFKIGA